MDNYRGIIALTNGKDIIIYIQAESNSRAIEQVRRKAIELSTLGKIRKQEIEAMMTCRVIA